MYDVIYSCNHIKNIFEIFGSEYDSIKLLSKMYQNNGLFLTEVIDNILIRDNMDGYSPLKGKMNMTNNLNRVRRVRKIDYRKVHLLQQVIYECKPKKIQLLFMVSPRYKTVRDKKYFEFAEELAKKNNILFYDFRNIIDVSNNPDFFKDPLHMNDNGALYYT